MKKFSLAAAAVLALASAVPAVADTKVSDDPFVSTQGLLTGNAGIGLGVAAIAIIAIAASGDS